MKAIGIDIGGTKIALAAVGQGGSILAISSFPTPKESGCIGVVKDLMSHIHLLCDRVGWAVHELDGVGIGCTGPIDPLAGTVHNPYTLPGWDDLNLVTPLRNEFRTRVLFENDADAAAVGEYLWGAGNQSGSMVMLTLGTGVGFSAIIDGEILRGSRGAHPEAGHLKVFDDGPQCYCGQTGCLESIASGTAISEQGRLAGYKNSYEVFSAAAEHSKPAIAIVTGIQTAISRAVWNLTQTFAPDAIVFGGGLMSSQFETLTSIARENIRDYPLADPPRLLKAEFAQHAGVVGAAALLIRPQRL